MIPKRDNSWFSIGLVAVLLGLLALLAGLQYKWLGQISEAESTRLKARLSDDTRRFSEDFNREIQLAYFGFQSTSSVFVPDQTNEFTKRYRYWQQTSGYPELVKGIYFYRNTEDPELLRFDTVKEKFVRAAWNNEMTAVRSRIGDGRELDGIIGEPLALTLPVFDEPEEIEHIIVRTKRILHASAEAVPPKLDLADKDGFLVLMLDKDVIADKLLPALALNYFSGSESANFNLSVVDLEGRPVFESGPGMVRSPDSSVKLMDLKPSGFNFIARREEGDEAKGAPEGKSRLLVSETYESRNVTETRGSIRKVEDPSENRRVDVSVVSSEDPAVTVFESKGSVPGGLWTLNVQHEAGSLDQFVANTRNRNLAISFGILGLLAVSTVFIIISAQRAKALAKKQLDFVSAVSHEFRTPLAVIYSAAENLSDGVVEDRGRITSYGSLIKREGRKLSGMVEQILEFAGARSGRRKYDFRELDVAELVERALEECVPQLEESGFELETDLQRGLPLVSADEQALMRAVQNLVSNAQKYSNGSRWIKVSVSNVDGKVMIAVEDRGIGISAEDRKHVFEPFYRSRSVVDEQISGNGLGLSIVKQIVDEHNGEITVESEEGNGSRFEIVLRGVRHQGSDAV